MMDDADAVGEPLGDLENMGRQDDRPTGARALDEDVLDQSRGGGVEAGQWLVEHQQQGIMDEGAGEGDLLLHAAREALAALMPVLPQLQHLQQFVGAGAGGFGLDAPQARDEFQIFQRVELVVKHGLVRQPCGDALGVDGLAARVDAEYGNLAGVGGQKPGDHPQGGRLAGAIGAEQGEKFASADAEVQPVHRDGTAKRLSQGAKFERGRFGPWVRGR